MEQFVGGGHAGETDKVPLPHRARRHQRKRGAQPFPARAGEVPLHREHEAQGVPPDTIHHPANLFQGRGNGRIGLQ